MRSRAKKLGIALGLTGILASVGGVMAKKTKIFDGTRRVQLVDGSVDVPTFNPIKLGAGNCSGYARRVAEEMFGKKYSFANAWDRRYKDRVVCEVEDNDDLRGLADGGVLKPGMLVGVFYPRSHYNDVKDMKGHPVKYTHMVVYIGEDPNGEPLFVEQFGVGTRERTLSQFDDHDLEAREIIGCN